MTQLLYWLQSLFMSCDNWEPPKTTGLSNSFPIIQKTYIDKMERGLKVDYFEILKDDLRNIRPLNNPQLEYIKNLNSKEMYEIIEIYNEITQMLVKYADLTN